MGEKKMSEKKSRRGPYSPLLDEVRQWIREHPDEPIALDPDEVVKVRLWVLRMRKKGCDAGCVSVGGGEYLVWCEPLPETRIGRPRKRNKGGESKNE